MQNMQNMQINMTDEYVKNKSNDYSKDHLLTLIKYAITILTLLEIPAVQCISMFIPYFICYYMKSIPLIKYFFY